jgi:hypothetical protein
MKHTFALLFSVLLLVAQAMAVATPANAPHCTPKSGCCGDQCDCSVSTSSGAAPVREATAPGAPQTQLFLLVPAWVLFELAAPANFLPSVFSRTVQSSVTTPLFRLNCTLLI